MFTPADYNDHQRPYVNSFGELRSDFYSPEVTDQQYSRYTTLPPFDLEEATIRVLEFTLQGYQDIAGIVFDPINPVTKELTTNMQAQACLPSYPLMYEGTLRGPYLEIDYEGKAIQQHGIKLYKRVGSLPVAIVFSELFANDVDTTHRLRTAPIPLNNQRRTYGGYK